MPDLSSPTFEILVHGSSFILDVGGIGISTCALIRTSDGPIVFDVGSHVSRDMLKLGLSKAGLAFSDIPRVFLSHMHFDHVMNIDLFPKTTKVFVSRTEWEYAANPNPADDWVPWGIHEQLKKYDLQLVDGVGELSPGVRYLPTPGHTPGCYSISIDQADGSRAILAGDALKFPKEAILGRADHAFDTKEVAAQSIRTIVEQGDIIVPGHYSTLTKENGQITWSEPQKLFLMAR